MSVGDLVRVKSINGCPLGIIISIDAEHGWPSVLIEDGREVIWPKTQMELINERR